MKTLHVAVDKEDHEFGVMTDKRRISNGLFRFGHSPTMLRILNICKQKDSPRFRALNITDCVYLPHTEVAELDNYFIATNVASHPNQWTGEIEGVEKQLLPGDIPDRSNLFENMIPECLADLQSGKAFLLLDQTHEGYNAHWLWQWFYKSITKYKISAKQIIFITGDLQSPDLHTKYCEENLIQPENRITVFGFSLFEESVYFASKFDWAHDKLSWEENIQYKADNPEEIKIYNCLQKRPRNHRLWLYKELYYNNILDKGINTMNFIEPDQLTNGAMWFHNEMMEPEIIVELNNTLPCMPEKFYENYQNVDMSEFSEIESGKYVMMLNKAILQDSWVSVISEASVSNDQCFCSEKIFKPIVQEHPFLVWGDRYTMQKMRELGYQTFDNWWSEDWDHQDVRNRLDNLTATLVDLCKLSHSDWMTRMHDMKSVLKHNSELLTHKSQEEVRDEIKFIAGRIS